MKKYDKYKPSGVEWIGDIPEHWEVIRLKYIGDSIIGVVYNLQEITQNENNGILVLRSSNIQNGLLSLDDTVYINKDISKKFILKKGDILICSRNGSKALIGKNITINDDMEGSTFGAFMTIFRTKYFEFMSKYFNSQVFSGQSNLFLTSTINQLTINTINNFLVALPSKQEQQQIANYLDKKTTEIDKIMTDKENLIKLLEEEKEIIISNAVTHGLNPDVEIKDSGVEWIGNIPEHWEVKKIKFCSNIYTGRTPSTAKGDYFTNGQINWFTPVDIDNKILLKSSKRKVIYKAVENEEVSIYKKGSTLVVGIGSTIGKTAFIISNSSCNQQLHVVTFKEQIINIYGFYILYILGKEIKSFANFVTLPILNQFDLKNLFIQIPPKQEQQEIVEYLDKKTDEINQTTQTIKNEIKLLKEYKEILIYEVVTGKIDVREEIVS